MKIAALCLLCGSSLALAQTEVKVSIAPSGGDYTSLVTWEAGEEADLVALNENHVAEISGSWSALDLGPVLVDGWVTDGTHFVTIRAVGAARHAGRFPEAGSGPHVLSINPTDTDVLTLGDFYTKLEGLSILQNSQNNSSTAINVSAAFGGAGVHTLDSCLAFVGPNYQPTSQTGFNISYALNAASYIVNCVADGFDNGFKIGQNVLGVFVNCTAVECGQSFTVQGGYENSAVPTFINCVSTLCTQNGFYYGIVGGLSDYNISDRAGEATPPPGTHSKVATTLLADTTSLYQDYHLSPSDTAARGFCAPYTGNAGITFTTDFEGHERGETTWDAGADEFGSSAPVTGRGQVIITSQ